jgi:excisionase family DNA binding protein
MKHAPKIESPYIDDAIASFGEALATLIHATIFEIGRQSRDFNAAPSERTLVDVTRLYTTAEGCQLIRCSQRYFRELVREGKISSLVVGGNLKIPGESILRFLREHAK